MAVDIVSVVAGGYGLLRGGARITRLGFSIGMIKVVSGTTGLLLRYNTKCQNEEWRKNLSRYVSYIELATLGGQASIHFLKKAQKSADDAITAISRDPNINAQDKAKLIEE